MIFLVLHNDTFSTVRDKGVGLSKPEIAPDPESTRMTLMLRKRFKKGSSQEASSSEWKTQKSEALGLAACEKDMKTMGTDIWKLQQRCISTQGPRNTKTKNSLT